MVAGHLFEFVGAYQVQKLRRTWSRLLTRIRLGTIFMDLDALSGVVAYKHTGDDVTTVTAACDRITIRNPLTEICDLEYSGRVTYATGRSSMEITLQVAKAPKEGEKVKDEDVLLHCSFTMVSLDPGTKKLVPMLSLTNSVLTRGQTRQRQPHRP